MLAISPTITKHFLAKLDQQKTVNAYQPTLQPENVMVVSVVAKPDDRATRLKKFLRSQASPMAGDAEALVKIADKYGLDWTFLPAIAALESQYGKMIPTGSFNPYGWNNGRASFASFADASEEVASGIRSRYQPEGEVTAWGIGSRYAASKTWAVRVVAYQEQIARF
jgi:hypothetical protein